MRLSVFCLFGLLGCGVESSGRNEANLGRTASPIIGGTESTTADDAVVALAHAPGGQLTSLCTGTLVAPNLILTARHCVAETDESATCTSAGKALAGGRIGVGYIASDIHVYRGVAATTDMRVDTASRRKSVGRGKVLVVEGSTTYCNADVAFVVLDRDVPGPYAPIRTRTTTKVAELVSAVGYGLTSTGNVPAMREKRTGIPILGVGPLPLVGLGNAELLVGESSCSGDSGGPILASSGAVIGVVSRGGGGTGPIGNLAASCTGATARAVYTHVGMKAALVALAYRTAGHAIWSEGARAPWEACTGGNECSVCSAAGACVSVEPEAQANARPDPPIDDEDAADATVSGTVDVTPRAPGTPDASATADDHGVRDVNGHDRTVRAPAAACSIDPHPSAVGGAAPVALLLLALALAARRRAGRGAVQTT